MEKQVRQISKEEDRLLDYLRKLEWGEAVVQVKNGKPIMVSQARQDIKLTD